MSYLLEIAKTIIMRVVINMVNHKTVIIIVPCKSAIDKTMNVITVFGVSQTNSLIFRTIIKE